MTPLPLDARGRPRLDWAINAEACQILAAAAADPAVLAWAAGVIEACHALYLARIPIPPEAIRPEHHGASLPADHVWYEGKRNGWQVYRSVEDTSRPVRAYRGETIYEYVRVPLAAGSWTAVRALVDPARVGTALRAEIAAVLAERREHTPRYDPTESRRGWTDADWAAEFARQDVGAGIERRCQDLGAQVWDACRPGAPEIQLSLFEVAA